MSGKKREKKLKLKQWFNSPKVEKSKFWGISKKRRLEIIEKENKNGTNKNT